MSLARTPLLAAGLVFLLSPAADVRAQSGLYDDVEAPAVQIELAKAFFETGDFGFATSVLNATVLVPLRPSTTLFAGWGVSYATVDPAPSSTTTSNLRLGTILGAAGGTRGELHVDLPVATEHGDDDFATGVGFFTDYERFERFLPDAWSIGGSVVPQRELESGAVVGGRLGFTLLMPTEDGPDSEIFLLPGVFGTLPAGSARLGAELSSSIIASEEGLSLNERSVFQTTLWAEFPAASLAPQIYLRVPLDDELSDVIDFVIGARVRLGG